jgi:hypothetical protein
VTEDGRPDPLGALRAAAEECGVELRDGLLEQVLELESEPAEQEAARSMIQARLRTLIETSARSTT